MSGICPLTGETAQVAEAGDQVVVNHARLGRYVLEAMAISSLKTDAGLKERMARWIVESRSLNLDPPILTMEHLHLFERLPDLEAAISEWHDRREGMRKADEERLWRKLRLEWNYNSNHLEGNTLTYHETELLLIHGRTAGGHPMRHYEEMKAHDVAISHTRSLAREEQLLREGDIRDLNKILLKEPFWHSAETSDGQPTRKHIIPGQYKTQPNHVRTATGELHRFAEPAETRTLMEEWTRAFRRDLDRTAYPLPMFLAESHWSFLRIHPFDDGNGRTARLLMNYALLRNFLPPVVIKSEERNRYISSLQNADVGRLLPLAAFMLESVSCSLRLGIKSAKGESIREPDDMDKEMDVFIQERRGPAPNNSDVEVLDQVFFRHVNPMLEKLDRMCERQGAELFGNYVPIKSVRLVRNGSVFGDTFLGRRGGTTSGDVLGTDQWERTKRQYLARPGFALSDEQQVELEAKYNFHGYIGTGNHGFDLELLVVWKLCARDFSFEAAINGFSLTAIGHHILYSELDIRDAEVDHTVEAICRCMMDAIDSQSHEPRQE